MSPKPAIVPHLPLQLVPGTATQLAAGQSPSVPNHQPCLQKKLLRVESGVSPSPLRVPVTGPPRSAVPLDAGSALLPTPTEARSMPNSRAEEALANPVSKPNSGSRPAESHSVPLFLTSPAYRQGIASTQHAEGMLWSKAVHGQVSLSSPDTQGEHSAGEDKRQILLPYLFPLLESLFFPRLLKWQLILTLLGGHCRSSELQGRQDGTRPMPLGDFPLARVLNWAGDCCKPCHRRPARQPVPSRTSREGKAEHCVGEGNAEHRALPVPAASTESKARARGPSTHLHLQKNTETGGICQSPQQPGRHQLQNAQNLTVVYRPAVLKVGIGTNVVLQRKASGHLLFAGLY